MVRTWNIYNSLFLYYRKKAWVQHTIVCHQKNVPVQHTIVYHKKRPAFFKHHSSVIFLLPYIFLSACFLHHASQTFSENPAVNLTHQATPLCPVYRGTSTIKIFHPYVEFWIHLLHTAILMRNPCRVNLTSSFTE